MGKPTRHQVLVEITDMSGKLSTKRIGQVIHWAIDRAMHGDIDLNWLDVGQLMRLRVKDPRRVRAAKKP